MIPDPYQNQPTTVVFALFAETANRLVGAYSSLSDQATTLAERESWWNEAIAVRDAREAVRADDRTALVALIRDWQEELQRIETSPRG